MAKFKWNIEIVSNGSFLEGKESEAGFRPYTCNAYTHGMEKYHHLNFQIVLKLSNDDISYILNTLAQRVHGGERFQAGDMVSGIFEDCDIRLDEYEENGRTVLRVMIPDEYNVFPEKERCMPEYRLQLLETKDLIRAGSEMSFHVDRLFPR